MNASACTVKPFHCAAITVEVSTESCNHSHPPATANRRQPGWVFRETAVGWGEVRGHHRHAQRVVVFSASLLRALPLCLCVSAFNPLAFYGLHLSRLHFGELKIACGFASCPEYRPTALEYQRSRARRPCYLSAAEISASPAPSVFFAIASRAASLPVKCIVRWTWVRLSPGFRSAAGELVSSS